MKLILAFYLETPFVDPKNCSEEVKNTLCVSGTVFHKESIIFTSQMCGTEAPHMLWPGRFAVQTVACALCSRQGSVCRGCTGWRAAPLHWGSAAGGQWWQQVTGSDWQAQCPQRHHPAQAPRPAGTVLALLGVRNTTECNWIYVKVWEQTTDTSLL